MTVENHASIHNAFTVFCNTHGSRCCWGGWRRCGCGPGRTASASWAAPQCGSPTGWGAGCGLTQEGAVSVCVTAGGDVQVLTFARNFKREKQNKNRARPAPHTSSLFHTRVISQMCSHVHPRSQMQTNTQQPYNLSPPMSKGRFKQYLVSGRNITPKFALIKSLMRY